MNCKPGDLAIVVRSFAGTNDGKIVRCIRIDHDKRWKRCPTGYFPVDVAWLIEAPPGMLTWSGKRPTHADDDDLRPIRDQDGEDEILRIAGKPKELERA